jgi:hypothetical protein
MKGATENVMDVMYGGHQTFGVCTTIEKMLSITFAKWKYLEKFSGLQKRE